MKSMTKLMALAAMTLWTSALLAKDVSQEFKVDGWSCNSCSNKTAAAVKKIDGVKEAKGDVDKGVLTVTFDDAKVKPDAIVEVVKKVGYSCNLKDAPKKS